MIQLNHPDREKVKPLSVSELNDCATLIDITMNTHEEIVGAMPNNRGMLQNLISSYQNLQHFYDVAGGWDGLAALKKQSECNVTEAEHIALGYPNFTSDIKVEYEIVKGV